MANQDAPVFTGPLADALERINRLLEEQGVAIALTVNTQAMRRGETRFVSSAELVPLAGVRAGAITPEDPDRW